jgi:hypothetical protein
VQKRFSACNLELLHPRCVLIKLGTRCTINTAYIAFQHGLHVGAHFVVMSIQLEFTHTYVEISL